MEIFKVCMVVLLVLVERAFSFKILLLPTPLPSETSAFKHMGDALVDHGHHVYMVLPPSSPAINQIKQEAKLNLITYHMTEKDIYQLSIPAKRADKLMEDAITKHPLKAFEENGAPKKGLVQWCTNPLSDEDLFQTLNSLDFDITILDAHPYTRCYYILVYRLGHNYISVSTLPEFWLTRTPALPSFVPFVHGMPAYTTEMTFFERLDNCWTQFVWALTPGMIQRSDYLVAMYAPNLPPVSLNYLAGRSLLWFIDSDSALDYARPRMPNEVFIGGLTTKPAKPLPSDLGKIVSTAKHGIIVVSFGSSPMTIPKRIIKNIIGGLSQLRQVVIWQIVHNIPDELPENIHIVKHTPQADLFAHNNTKLFISHCEASGQFEALYHAVPMVGIPLFAEQRYNAKRMVYKGFGESIQVTKLSSDSLYNTIERVLQNPSYKANIEKASAIYRSHILTPTERVVHWTEHVLKYGADHLHSYALDMPWYEYLMLDILTFMLTIFIVIIFIVIALVWSLVRSLNTGNKEKET